MPYISEASKQYLADGFAPVSLGQLTYCFQQSMKSFLDNKQETYASFAECLGALAGAAIDLIWRKIIPYEAQKLKENGDVWTD